MPWSFLYDVHNFVVCTRDVYCLLPDCTSRATELSFASQTRTRTSSPLRVQKPPKPWDPWPQEGAVLHFLIGQCHIEDRAFELAHEAYVNAIHVDPQYSEVSRMTSFSFLKR